MLADSDGAASVSASLRDSEKLVSADLSMFRMGRRE
jgi:hypothetical protein